MCLENCTICGGRVSQHAGTVAALKHDVRSQPVIRRFLKTGQEERGITAGHNSAAGGFGDGGMGVLLCPLLLNIHQATKRLASVELFCD